MPMNPLAQSALSFVNAYFQLKPNGFKIKYGQDLSILKDTPLTPPHYLLTNSLIKLNDKIYQIQKGVDGFIGKGSFGKVKFAYDINSHNLEVLKIESKNEDHQKNETAALIDLGLTIGKVQRREKGKYYTPMPYLGQNLKTYLKKHTPTTNERLTLAISLCHQIYNLHSGRLSKTLTTYAHRDIKPENVVIDDSKNIHLVDYGFVTKGAKEKNTNSYGSAVYMAKYTRFINKTITNEQHDLLALRRTLYMPDSFIAFDKHRKSIQHIFPDWPMLLSKKIIDRYLLHRYIDTSYDATNPANDDRADISFDARQIAAVLVLAKLNFSYSYYEKVATDKKIASAILLSYFYYQDDKTLKTKIGDIIYCCDIETFYQQTSKLALLFDADLIDFHLDALANEDLMNALTKAKDENQKIALGILYKMELSHPDDLDKVIQKKYLAKAIIHLYRNQSFNALHQIFISQPHLRTLENLNQCDLLTYYDEICKRSPIAPFYIQKSKSKNLIKAFSLLALSSVKDETFFNKLIIKDNKRKFFLSPNDNAIKAILFLEKINCCSAIFWALKNNNIHSINALEKFSQSKYGENFKSVLTVCMLKISAFDELSAIFLEIGNNQEKLPIFLRLVAIGYNNFDEIKNILNLEAKSQRYLPLFLSLSYDKKVIFDVMNNLDYQNAFNVLTKFPITHKRRNEILSNKALVDKLNQTPKEKINTSFLLTLGQKNIMPHHVFFANAKKIQTKTNGCTVNAKI